MSYPNAPWDKIWRHWLLVTFSSWYCLFWKGHHQCSGLTPNSKIRNHSWRDSGDYIECQELSLSWSYVRQMPSQLYYLSSPMILVFLREKIELIFDKCLLWSLVTNATMIPRLFYIFLRCWWYTCLCIIINGLVYKFFFPVSDLRPYPGNIHKLFLMFAQKSSVVMLGTLCDARIIRMQGTCPNIVLSFWPLHIWVTVAC